METSSPMYAVTVEARLPEFETERLFVVNEKKYAHQELAKLERKPAAVRAMQGMVGALKPKDWQRYIQALDHYGVKLEDHREEIVDGLVPLKFFVINNGPELDETIKIRVRVEHGTIHPAKTAPTRPARVDNGPAHAPHWTPVSPWRSLVGGFSRQGVKITPHSVEATFSQLEAHDSADLVHQVLYVRGDADTSFKYEISSKRLGVVERGVVGAE